MNIKEIVEIALKEDVGAGDITASLIPDHLEAKATIITREAGIFCGSDYAAAVFQQINPDTVIEWKVQDGEEISPDQLLCTIEGKARPLLTAERTALNFLQTLSGTATLTHNYVKHLVNTKTKLLDTRKTIPGLRLAQKYAVKCGGGHNHRMGLYDAYLIKENHIAAAGSISTAVAAARFEHSDKWLEVEVETLEELQEALAAKVDRIMLDNFSISDIHKAVSIAKGKVELEVSGNIDLNNILDYAATGVDFISVGSITKHVHALDMSLRLNII